MLAENIEAACKGGAFLGFYREGGFVKAAQI